MCDKASFKVGSDHKELGVTAIALEMRRLAREAAVPVHPGETIKAQQRRGWEALKRPPFWRFRAAWYGEAGCWSAVAFEDLRRRNAERRKKEAKARETAMGLSEIYRTAAERLREIDADFHGAEIARLEQPAPHYDFRMVSHDVVVSN